MIIESYEDVIILSGALRSNFWDAIHTAISLTLKRHPSGVIIDCSGLSEATSAGAETFRDAMDFIQKHDARIIVAAVPPAVMEVLKSVPEVRSQLAVANSVEAARRSLDLLHENDDSPVRKKKRHAPDNARQLIVCLYTGTSVEEDDAAMNIAGKIADSQPTEVHLVCVLLVPRHLPLTSPLEASEMAASKAVQRAEQFFAVRDVTYVSQVERARDVASALAEVLTAVDAPEVVLPLMRDPLKKDENLKLVESVLARVNRNVIFVRGG